MAHWSYKLGQWGSLNQILFLPLGLRPLNEGHPRYAVVITDGKSVNAVKLESFSKQVKWTFLKLNSCVLEIQGKEIYCLNREVSQKKLKCIKTQWLEQKKP